ncbi:hypothetical protein HDU86_001925 [Geranomyces michiganensis]|nr:hypothetical protein HDU86_001925 [Geranomyces michiganensis]
MSVVEEAVIYADSPLGAYLNDVAAAGEDCIRATGEQEQQQSPNVDIHTVEAHRKPIWPPRVTTFHRLVKQRIHSFLMAELASTRAPAMPSGSRIWALTRTLWAPVAACAGWVCINAAWIAVPRIAQIPQTLHVALNVITTAAIIPVFHTAIASCQNILLRSVALAALDAYLGEIKHFDSTVRRGIRVVQEVELVAKGYRQTDDLTPIRFVEKSSAAKRCTLLRSALRNATGCVAVELAEAKTVFESLLEAHDAELDPSNPVDPELSGDEDDLAIASLKNAMLAVDQMNVDLLSVLLVVVPATGNGDHRWRDRVKDIVRVLQNVASALATGSQQIGDASDVNSSKNYFAAAASALAYIGLKTFA